ncbi:hypothetical protein JOQ06_003775, partial [Pogonophryne albipinna]
GAADSLERGSPGLRLSCNCSRDRHSADRWVRGSAPHEATLIVTLQILVVFLATHTHINRDTICRITHTNTDGFCKSCWVITMQRELREEAQPTGMKTAVSFGENTPHCKALLLHCHSNEVKQQTFWQNKCGKFNEVKSCRDPEHFIYSDKLQLDPYTKTGNLHTYFESLHEVMKVTPLRPYHNLCASDANLRGCPVPVHGAELTEGDLTAPLPQPRAWNIPGLDGETKPRPFLHRAPGGEGRGLGDRAGVGHVLGDRQEGGGRERSQGNK